MLCSSDLAVKILSSNSTHSLCMAKLLMQWAPVDSKRLIKWMKEADLQKSLPLLQTLVSRKHSDVGGMECLLNEKLEVRDLVLQ